MDGALYNNTTDDSSTNHLSYTANPNFTKAFDGAAANTKAKHRRQHGGFEGSSTQNTGQPTGFAVPQGAQADAFTADTTIPNLFSQSSHQAPPLRKAKQDHTEPLGPERERGGAIVVDRRWEEIRQRGFTKFF
jgi:hypothetical protein